LARTRQEHQLAAIKAEIMLLLAAEGEPTNGMVVTGRAHVITGQWPTPSTKSPSPPVACHHQGAAFHKQAGRRSFSRHWGFLGGSRNISQCIHKLKIM